MTPRKLLPNAAPKPKPAPPAKRQYSSIVDRRTHSEKIAASQRLRSTTPPKKKARTKQEKERIYGTDEKIAFVKSLPCAACRIVGYSEVAHSKTGGMGRKADARHSLPLCGPHPWHGAFGGIVEGCHAKLHREGRQTFESHTNCHLETAAAKTELAWIAFQSENSKLGGR